MSNELAFFFGAVGGAIVVAFVVAWIERSLK
jgi:hypothetical protein